MRAKMTDFLRIYETCPSNSSYTVTVEIFRFKRISLAMLQIIMTFVAVVMIYPTRAEAQGFPECYQRAEIVQTYGRQEGSYLPLLNGARRASDSAGLRSMLTQARDGDVIVVADGQYDIGRVQVSARIALFGETLWGATLKGDSILEILQPSVHIEGLRFQDGGAVSKVNSRDRSIHVKADGVRIINNWFDAVGVNSTVKDGGGMTILIEKVNGTVVANNRFTRGHGVAIKSTDHARNIQIVQNDFLDSPSYGGIGEIAQIGNAWSTGQAQSPHDDELYATIRQNFVCGWTLEGELISIKGNSNLIEGNLIERSSGSVFVVRLGNSNVFRNNIMRDVTAPPVSISGENNLIDGNCFETNNALASFFSEIGFIKQRKNLARAYWSAKNNIFRNNTYVGSTKLITVFKSKHINDIRKENIRPQYSLPSGNKFIGTTIYTKDTDRFLKLFSGDDINTAQFQGVSTHKHNPLADICSSFER